MLYCEPCRIKNKLRRPAAFPHCDLVFIKCDICNQRSECYDQPAIYAKDKKTWSLEEKQLDKMIQHDYHQKAEELLIAYASGSLAGGIDHERTAQMRNAVVQVNKETDWFATFEVRQRLQKGYKIVDQLKRNRR